MCLRHEEHEKVSHGNARKKSKSDQNSSQRAEIKKERHGAQTARIELRDLLNLYKETSAH